MIKILFMIPNLMHGGAEKVLVNLVNNMNKNKFDITLMTLFDVGVNKELLSEDIKYKYCFRKMPRGNSHLLKLVSPKTLFKKLIKDDYDIIVSYLEGPTARIVSGCTNQNTKLISWIHVEQHTKKNAARAFRNYNEACQCYSRFDQTICVSNYVKNDFLSIFPQIENIDVLYNTNETKQIIQHSTEPIDIEFKDNEIKLIGVGKVMQNKGFDRLARITYKLVNEGYPIHTYILGVGNQQESIQEYIDQKGINDQFTFLGYQKNPYKYVSKADMFVCSSFAEGFSTAATEALIVGTPVVTTLVSGMEEMLGNNEYGIITENNEDALYEGIKTLVSDEKMRNYYAAKALERGQSFSTEKTVEAVEQMLLRQVSTS